MKQIWESSDGLYLIGERKNLGGVVVQFPGNIR